MRLGAARFVAGETLDELVPVLRRLEGRGLLTNTTLLGEGVRSRSETEAVVVECRLILDRMNDEGLKTNLSVKLTHLGLAIDEELASENVAKLVEHAARLGNFVRIDMEESIYVDATLRIYRRLREGGHENIGTVLQSYLYRTEADLASLLDLQPNLRLVKGAYLEPHDVAYPSKADVDSAFVRIAERSLREGGFTAVATHDERLIEHVIGFCERESIDRARFQFQLLYGVRPQLQLSPGRTRVRRARRHAVRARLVPLPHAPARRTAGQRPLLRQEPRPRLTVSAQPPSAETSTPRGWRSELPRKASTTRPSASSTGARPHPGGSISASRVRWSGAMS